MALTLIWLTALALAAGSLAWLSLLIILRMVRDVRETRLARDRRAVIAAMVGMLSAPAAQPSEQIRPYIRRARLMAEAVLELQGLIRGSGQERVLSSLRELGLTAVLKQGLERGSKAGRLACLEALAAMGGAEAAEALHAAARQAEDPDVRLLAFKALSDLGTHVRLDALVEEIARKRVRPSRLLADVLRDVVTADPNEAMLALERPDLTQTGRALVLDALGWAGDYRAIPVLISQAGHDDVEVRIAAVRALGRLQHPAAEPALANALSDVAWPVRAAAAEASGLANLSRLSDPLAALLSDPEWWVRFRAADALVRLGRTGVSQLRLLAASGEPLAQRAAELALAERGL
jgi:HEAT repeat protein